MEPLNTLFDTSGFPPRWRCGTWTEVHGWTHIIADVGIFAAYMAIPITLAYLIFRRGDLPFYRIFWLFAAFILCCGFGHLVEATIFWNPWYRFSALVKVATAVVSWATVLALIPLIPKIVALPGMAALNADLDRRVKLRTAELSVRNEELDSFAYAASHDLRTPLRNIDTLASWIEEDGGDELPEACREHVTTLKERVRAMDGLLMDLLQYSRIGRKESEPEEVFVQELVDEVKLLLEPPGGVEVVYASENVAINCSRTAIRRVLQNLIGNAVKHRDGAQGRIEVHCEDEGERFRFRVSDDGPGIDPKFHDKIFEVFQTLGGETDGTGMGLAMVRKTVQNHGGTIRVDSAVGEGATFHFTWMKNPDESPVDPGRVGS